MKRAIKVVFSVFLLVALMAGTIVNVYAFTIEKTHIIDNDDAQGYSNEKVGFDTLIQASNLYYQDARTQVCNSDENYYRYNIVPIYRRYTYIHEKVSAYLYNTKFTDPTAQYLCIGDRYYVAFSAGYINQDLAAAGWNIIGTAVITSQPAGGPYWATSVELHPSSTNPTKTCGADAIKTELGYN